VLNLQVLLVGTTKNFTIGRASECKEGDFVLYDPSRPLNLSFTEPTQVIVLRLPIALIEQHVPRLRGLVGVRVRGDRGPGAVFSGFLRSAWRQMQTDDGDWVDTLNTVIWPLLDMAYANEPRAGIAAGRRGERKRELFGIIEREICDPALDARSIATVMGVSARYVQMIFAEMATTPSAYIQQRRLDLAAHRLAREGAQRLITDVAFDCGFSDLSSFCRAFRRRFAVAPRDYRAGRRSAAAGSLRAQEAMARPPERAAQAVSRPAR
jgi:AraC-like DNA-binding protein